jgi:hypothetical protein
MKRLLVPFSLALLTAGCSSEPRVIVRASLEPGGPVADLPVRLLPYDRQAVLDSLAATSGSPEPLLPHEVIQILHGDTSAGRAASAKPPVTRADSAAALTPERARAIADSVRKAQREWAARAYRGFDSAVLQRVQASGRGEEADTTGTDGVVRFAAKEGSWWVWAHYTLPDEELDWLIPVRVPRDGKDSIVVELNRANAVSRPFL